MYAPNCGLEEVFMSWGHDGTSPITGPNDVAAFFNISLLPSALPDLRAGVCRISLQSDEVQQVLHPRGGK